MGSLLDELGRREEAARVRAEELREQIAELNQRLAAAEAVVARLVTAREVVGEILAEAGQPIGGETAGLVMDGNDAEVAGVAPANSPGAASAGARVGHRSGC
ncbi:hypothetical protein ACFWYW_00080 [Nonomuraea sp. NPDC059023]|uniref:hypothetical protein n=1 Tax=unclassified Nonomuraea TaxID=2593643 RepID=UPI0036B41D54